MMSSRHCPSCVTTRETAAADPCGVGWGVGWVMDEMSPQTTTSINTRRPANNAKRTPVVPPSSPAGHSASISSKKRRAASYRRPTPVVGACVAARALAKARRMAASVLSSNVR